MYWFNWWIKVFSPGADIKELEKLNSKQAKNKTILKY